MSIRTASTSSFPSGSHAGGVMKTYGDLGMRQAGVRLIGPMDLIPDYELARMSDAAIGLDRDVELCRTIRHAGQPGIRQGVARGLRPEFLSRLHVGRQAGTPWPACSTSSTRCMAISMTARKWSTRSRAGPTRRPARAEIQIDPETRDVIQDEHAEEVIKKPDGKLGVKMLETLSAGERPMQGPESRPLRILTA